MRHFLLVAGIFTVALLACLKPRDQRNTVLVDLTISTTNTPSSQTQGQDIVSVLSCWGPNLCYKFSKFEIREISSRQFEIRAKANFPKNKNIACAQAIYEVDTAARISTPVRGEYLLHFYNQSMLLKTDTVQVN